MDTRDQAGGPRAGATAAERAAFNRTSPTQPDPGQSVPSQSDPSRRAQTLARDAIDSGTAAADSVRERVTETVGRGQQHAADKVEEVADSLRRSADSMPDDQGWLSDLTIRGARQLSDMAETLRQNDLQGLLSRVDGFARNQPALFLGASMAAGFALARTAQVTISRATASTGRAARNDSSPVSPSPIRTTVTEPAGNSRHDGSAETSGPGMSHTEAPHG